MTGYRSKVKEMRTLDECAQRIPRPFARTVFMRKRENTESKCMVNYAGKVMAVLMISSWFIYLARL